MLRRMPRKISKIRTQPHGVTALGDRLRILRTELGWDQPGLARRAELKNREQISNLETGRTKNLTAKTGPALARAFGVGRDTLERYLVHGGPLEELLLARQSGQSTRPPETHMALLARMAARSGIIPEPLLGLLGDTGVKMSELPENVRRAVMGLVYLLGCSLETAVATTEEVLAENRHNASTPSEELYTAISRRVPNHKTSGTFVKTPSTAEIKSAVKVQE